MVYFGFNDVDRSGFLSTLFDLGGCLGSILCGFVSDRVLGGRRMLVVGPMSLGTGLMMMTYGPVG